MSSSQPNNGSKVLPSYGSLTNPSSNNGATISEEGFEVSNVYYLKDTHSSKEETCRKRWGCGVPLVVAICLMGGLVWLLTRDFGHLYPKYGGSSSSSDNVVIPTSSSSSTSNTVSSSETPSNDIDNKVFPTSSLRTNNKNKDAACEVHDACMDLGLIGQCCPTTNGDMLDCC